MEYNYTYYTYYNIRVKYDKKKPLYCKSDVLNMVHMYNSKIYKEIQECHFVKWEGKDKPLTASNIIYICKKCNNLFNNLVLNTNYKNIKYHLKPHELISFNDIIVCDDVFNIILEYVHGIEKSDEIDELKELCTNLNKWRDKHVHYFAYLKPKELVSVIKNAIMDTCLDNYRNIHAYKEIELHVEDLIKQQFDVLSEHRIYEEHIYNLLDCNRNWCTFYYNYFKFKSVDNKFWKFTYKRKPYPKHYYKARIHMSRNYIQIFIG